MEPTKGQFDNVRSLDAKRAEKEAKQPQKEKMWGPQHAGVVKKFEKKND